MASNVAQLETPVSGNHWAYNLKDILPLVELSWFAIIDPGSLIVVRCWSLAFSTDRLRWSLMVEVEEREREIRLGSLTCNLIVRIRLKKWSKQIGKNVFYQLKTIWERAIHRLLLYDSYRNTKRNGKLKTLTWITSEFINRLDCRFTLHCDNACLHVCLEGGRGIQNFK